MLLLVGIYPLLKAIIVRSCFWGDPCMIVVEKLHALHVVLEFTIRHLCGVHFVWESEFFNVLREYPQIPFAVYLCCRVEFEAGQLHLRGRSYSIEYLTEANPVTAGLYLWIVCLS